jgi:hypothetical protein
VWGTRRGRSKEGEALVMGLMSSVPEWRMGKCDGDVCLGDGIGWESAVR